MNLSPQQEVDVLVFDSGVGGLTVLEEIRRHLPDLTYAYLADNAGLPYGNKADAWLIERIMKVIAEVLKQVMPRILVIACNTASTLILPHLRATYSFPIVGVVPAIKPAAALSPTKVFGLLATPATINRSYIDKLIEEFASECHVIRVGDSKLVELAERKLRGEAVDTKTVAAICSPFLEHDRRPDTIVLGCTHFPILKEEISQILPGVILLDSGPAIARRVAQLLSPGKKSHGFTKAAVDIAYFTCLDGSTQKLQAALTGYRLGKMLDLGLAPPTQI